jgi:hypothetical protein
MHVHLQVLCPSARAKATQKSALEPLGVYVNDIPEEVKQV